jgi:Pvc16 N-terminal domain/IPT/TIG domain
MSNYLAIATVTAVLRYSLGEVVGEFPGAQVTTRRPEAMKDGNQNKAVINIFLYQVMPNAAWRNADLPTRNADGGLVKHPQAALDLHYLLSFYGEESELVPQRLLGRAIGAFHARPLLSWDQIQNMMKGDQFGYLRESNLGEQIERVRFSPLSLNLEELSKLWSVFFQVPYALSVAYQASVVLIEAEEEMPQRALPVLKRGEGDRGWASFLGGIPQIEQIWPPFVEPGAAITLKGRNLVAGRCKVVFGRPPRTFEQPAMVTPAGDLQVQLPPGLPAGIIPVSVHTGGGIASNPAALVLRPRVVNAQQKQGEDGQYRQGLTVQLEPKVQPGQRGLLLLNERKDDMHDTQPRRAYSIALPRRQGATDTITLEIPQVKPATYLVRVQIDAAESQLEPPAGDGEPYAGPLVTIR